MQTRRWLALFLAIMLVLSSTSIVISHAFEQEQTGSTKVVIPKLAIGIQPPLIIPPTSQGTTTGIPKTQFVVGEPFTLIVSVSNIGDALANNVHVRLSVLDSSSNPNLLGEHNFDSIGAGTDNAVSWQINSNIPGTIIADASYYDEAGNRYDGNFAPFTTPGFPLLNLVPKTYIVYGEEETKPDNFLLIERLALDIETNTGNKPSLVRDTNFYPSNIPLFGWFWDIFSSPLNKDDFDLVLVGSPSSNRLVAELFPERVTDVEENSVSTTIVKINEELGVVGAFVFATKTNPYNPNRIVTLISAPNPSSLDFLLTNLVEPTLRGYVGYDIASAFQNKLATLPQEYFDQPEKYFWLEFFPNYACDIGDWVWCTIDVALFVVPIEGAAGWVVGKVASGTVKVVARVSGKWVAKEVAEITLDASESLAIKTLAQKGEIEYVYPHALESLSKRSITSSMIEEALKAPDKIFPGYPDRIYGTPRFIFQKTVGDKTFIVVVEHQFDHIQIVTVIPR